MRDHLSPSPLLDFLPQPMFLVVIGVLTIAVTRVLCRLSRHPLSKYPGPLLAALTSWYRAYFDIVRDGGWSCHLESLHQIYGPIVRVGPKELHFSDPDAYGDIYGMGTRFMKEPRMYSSFATNQSVFALWDHQVAMNRRNLIGSFFSRRSILKLENMVQSKIDVLVSKLIDYQNKGQPANLDLAFRCLSLDIITSYCFSASQNALDSKDFENEVLLAIDNTTPMIWVFKHFPLIQRLLLGVPECFASVLKPSTKGILEQRRQMGKQIDGILKDPASLDNVDHETIYHQLLSPQPDNVRHPPLTRDWLLDEGLYLRFAGSDTVGNTCTIATYYILQDKEVQKKLLDDLRDVWPDRDICPGYEVLEKVPYLTAVVKESLRMAHGVVTPLPRIVGPTPAKIANELIPPGTVVSMGATILHRNPDIFTQPHSFIPERWLQSNSVDLDKYLVAFSKGPRGCLGINLAWCELTLTIATVFRKLDMVLHNASAENISYREYFVPLHRGRRLHAFIHQRER